MTFIFQITLALLVFLSFAMVIYVPVAYATPQKWDQSKSVLYLGSAIWVALVVVVGVLNSFVV